MNNKVQLNGVNHRIYSVPYKAACLGDCIVTHLIIINIAQKTRQLSSLQKPRQFTSPDIIKNMIYLKQFLRDTLGLRALIAHVI